MLDWFEDHLIFNAVAEACYQKVYLSLSTSAENSLFMLLFSFSHFVCLNLQSSPQVYS